MHISYFKTISTTLLAVGALSLSSPSWAARKAVTPSGFPEMLFVDMVPTEAGSKIANHCMNMGHAVISSTPNEVTCESPMGVMKASITQALLGGNYSTTPRRFARYTLVQVDKYVRVQASAWLEMQNAFGQTQRQSFTDDNTHNFLIDVMAYSGAKYIPGTKFPNRAYLGIGFRGVSDISIKNRKSLGMEVMFLTDDGPLKANGVKIGDIVYSINNKNFKDQNDFEKFLSRVKIGSDLTIGFLRNGSENRVSFVASERPTIMDIESQ